MSEPKFRKVNENLGKQPGVGPFPAEQIIPWSMIFGASIYICRALGFSWTWTGVVALWGISTWWVITGSKPWRFLAKFVGTPYWVRGYGRYRRILGHEQVTNEKPQ
ncbi:hypothetical protein [Coleofasciculus sp.]|uniref:hypothetical protein n=1 Tax=Coleofasciculus sp. TaxID=3100458 RepID=UPI0039FAE8C1